MKDAFNQDKKLGRGLSALLGESKSKNYPNLDSPSKTKIESIELIEIKKITAGLYQPRQFFNQEELLELAESIKENGLIQPILLRKGDEDDHYEIVAGERRFRASKLAGLTKIPALIRKINNHEALELAIIENVQRADLSLLEEAQGFKQLIDEFSYTQEQVAKKVGKSRSHVTNMIRLLGLPNQVREMLENKSLSMGHARAIANAKNPVELANKIVANQLNVREAEELLRDEKVANLKNTPVLVRTESKIKFVNSSHLVDLENKLSKILDTNVKIHYNQFKNSGKITIDFNDFDAINYLITKLK